MLINHRSLFIATTLILLLMGSIGYGQKNETIDHITAVSITCLLEEGGYTGGSGNPDELYCLVSSPSGQTKRVNLGKWTAVTTKETSYLMVNESLVEDNIINMDFWECDTYECGETGVDDFIGSVQLKIKDKAKVEWIAGSKCVIKEEQSNKKATIQCTGSYASYLIEFKIGE